jgi:hypothetical protein
MKIFIREKDFREAMYEHDEKIRRMEMIERALCENAELKERIIILEQRLDALENGNRDERREP